MTPPYDVRSELPALPDHPSLAHVDVWERDHVDQWLERSDSPETRRAYRRDLAQLQAWYGRPLRELRSQDVANYKRALMTRYYSDAGTTGATVARKLGVVKSFVTFLHREGAIRSNVAANVKAPPVKDTGAQRQLSRGQVFKLFNYAGGKSGAYARRNRLLLKTMYATGARVSEIVNLRWVDVRRFEDIGTLTFTLKGGETNVVGVSGALLHELLEYRKQSGADDSARVFGVENASGVWKIVRREAAVHAVDREGNAPTNVSPHWLRHAHATHAHELNAPLAEIAKTLGHRSLQSTRRYVKLTAKESSSLRLGV